MCRKARGGLFGTALGFPDGAVTVTKGEVKYFKSSETFERGFCADCGSPLVIREPGKSVPGTVMIGSLDRPDDWPLNQEGWWGHNYIESKVSWYEICDDLPQHVGPAGWGG